MTAFRKGIPVLFFLASALQASAPLAADPVRAGLATGGSPIHISSDRLEVYHAEQRAEFIGRVSATQGTTVLTADRLTVHYRPAGDASTGGVAEPGAKGPMSGIDRIVSSGSVVIRFDNKVAEGDKAIYNTASGILELTGAPCRVTSDGNVVTGSKITVYRAEDRVSVEGETADRVKAIIFTQDGQLAPQTTGGGKR